MSQHDSYTVQLKENFVEYVYHDNFFQHHEVDTIRQLWNDDIASKATLSGENLYDDEIRKSSVISIADVPEHDWIYNRLVELSIVTNNKHYLFDLLGLHQELQLTRYGVGDFFDWHLDFGAGEISARKLSMTVQLSDPDEYEGGDLQFMVNHRVVCAPRDKGTAIIFPSFIQHRVTPITKGERQSIVGWVSGPPYR
ncbi:MAG: 2OG-Fe(II) oxygenase [Deltaproteobacteria bacterium]|nr:MAG: 2OG-Fe(II) oxygenase [Deltaproteobacteria bacterium]